MKLLLRTLTIVNKKDTVSNEKINKIIKEIKSKEIIKRLKNSYDNLKYLIVTSFEELFEYSTIFKRSLFISAKNKENISELISALFDMLCTCRDIN